MKRVLKLQTRRVRFEALEHRQMLAGGGYVPVLPPPPAPVVHMSVTTQVVSVADVLPGTQFVLGKDTFTVTAGKNGRVNKGQLFGIDLLPADGSDDPTNLANVQVWANAKGGNAKDGLLHDGYETLLGTGWPDWSSNSLDISTKGIWVSGAGLKVEYIATANSYMDGDTIGANTELVTFRDLRGNFVDDGNVVYKGVDPTLHTLESQRLQISQQSGDKYGSALTGQRGVSLFQFGDWWTGTVSQTVTFTASQGSLDNI